MEYRSFGKLDWQVSVPCTQCRDCMPCPNGVDIPANFDAYNRGIVHNDLDTGRLLYSRMSLSFGQAGKCTQCCECEPGCPPQIPIGEWMPRVHAVLGEGQPYPDTRS